MCATTCSSPFFWFGQSRRVGLGIKLSTEFFEARFRPRGKAVLTALRGCRVETKTADLHYSSGEHGSHRSRFWSASHSFRDLVVTWAWECLQYHSFSEQLHILFEGLMVLLFMLVVVLPCLTSINLPISKHTTLSPALERALKQLCLPRPKPFTLSRRCV